MIRNRKKCLFAFSAAVLLLAAFAQADPQSDTDDPIAALIRRLRGDKVDVKPAPSPLPTAVPFLMSTAVDPLDKTYELMARNLWRAAARHNMDLLRQTRANVEEMLRAMLIQASYETGRFRSRLAVKACNYWGMKDRDDVGQERIHYKGEYYERFASMYAGCAGYIQALNRPRYQDVANHSHNKKEFLAALAASGWCPKKTYVDEALKIYEADQRAIDRAVKVAVDELVEASRR